MITTHLTGPSPTKSAKTAAGSASTRTPSRPAAGDDAAQAAPRKSTTTKAAAKAGVAGKASVSKAPATRAAVTKSAKPRASAGKSVAARPPASKSAARAKPDAAGASAGTPRKISPEQALANTRGLLEAKRGHDRQQQSWQALGPAAPHPGSEGFQSPSAMDRAEELHAGESRMTAIEGSVSTRGRQEQGKRDHR